MFKAFNKTFMSKEGIVTKMDQLSDVDTVARRLLKENPLSKIQRVTELLVDWLMICLYLIVLFLVVSMFNFFTYGTVFPYYSESTSQMIATFTTTVPITLIFAWMEYRWGGSMGKIYAEQIVYFEKRTFLRSVCRNLIKFTPWQLGHMAVIRFMYHEPDTIAIILFILSIGLMVLFFVMGLWRKDKRHLADLLVGTQVQLKQMPH